MANVAVASSTMTKRFFHSGASSSFQLAGGVGTFSES